MDAVDLPTLESLVTIDGQLCIDLAIEVIDVFLREIPLRHQEMAEAMADGDFERVKALAHKTKGTSSGIGAMRLAAMYACLEEHVLEKDRVFVDRLLGDLADEFDTVAFTLTGVRESFLGASDQRLG